ncbi:MAG: histidine kinase [Verrucomicrobia bacterium]|nr:histidine kinase [Verrucomicrobiota bacterium]
MYNGVWVVIGGLVFLLGISDLWLESIFAKICFLISSGVVLNLLPRSGRAGASLLAVRDRWSALIVFLLLGFVEDYAVRDTSWLNQRIVAVTAASLLAGVGVGVVVRLFVVWLAISYDPREISTVAIVISSGVLFGGLIHRWKPTLAEQPLTGFCLAASVSFLRDIWILLYVPSETTAPTLGRLFLAPILQGLGAALTLAMVAKAREQDDQHRAAARAEVRALQARLNPRFLGDALNSLAGFATAESQKIPYAVGHLRRFLRASFDQHDQPFVRLEEELSVVSAYLEIESMRWPGELEVVQKVDPRGLQALIPPFALQGLVENAVVHGRPRAPQVCRVQIAISAKHERLEMTVTDNGTGVPGAQLERVFFPERSQLGRLILLRRQLEQLFGKSFKLEIDSEIGAGTRAALSLPLRIDSATSPELKAGRSRVGSISTAQVVVAEKADVH